MRFGALLAGAGLAVAVMLASAPPAAAKGISEVVIDGEAMEAPLELDADVLSRLALDLPDFGLDDETDGAVSMSRGPSTPLDRHVVLTASSPTSSLGPALTVTWTFYGMTGTIEQELYPNASGGPLVHTEPGQWFYGSGVRDGWFAAAEDLVDKLRSVGLPDRTQLAGASAGSGAEPERATTDSQAGAGSGSQGGAGSGSEHATSGDQAGAGPEVERAGGDRHARTGPAGAPVSGRRVETSAVGSSWEPVGVAAAIGVAAGTVAVMWARHRRRAVVG